MQKPGFRTINSFRQRHLNALGELFLQVLQLCRRSGLVSLGHVSLDGTKIRANASKRKSMSYSRMKKEERRLQALVSEWLKRAQAADAREDEARTGQRMPQSSKGRLDRLGGVPPLAGGAMTGTSSPWQPIIDSAAP